MHEQQRSSEPSVSGDVYVTKSKGRMASKFKNLSKYIISLSTLFIISSFFYLPMKSLQYKFTCYAT